MRTDPRQGGFYSVLMDVRDAAASILDKTSLADVVARNAKLESAR